MSVLINFRIDSKLKKEMEKVCKELGITMSAAFNMFAKNLVKTKNINFSLNKKLDEGIDFQHLFENFGNYKEDKGVIKNDLEEYKDVFEYKDKYLINKIGKVLMLVPKDDPWAGLKEVINNALKN